MPPNGVAIRIIERDGNGSWRLFAPGCVRATAVAENRADVEVRGQEILRNLGGGELHIRGQDGAPARVRIICASNVPARQGKVYRSPRGTYSG
jgi:hypothetical protein